MEMYCVFGPDGRGGMVAYLINAENARAAERMAFEAHAVKAILGVNKIVQEKDQPPRADKPYWLDD